MVCSFFPLLLYTVLPRFPLFPYSAKTLYFIFSLPLFLNTLLISETPHIPMSNISHHVLLYSRLLADYLPFLALACRAMQLFLFGCLLFLWASHVWTSLDSSKICPPTKVLCMVGTLTDPCCRVNLWTWMGSHSWHGRLLDVSSS